MSDFAMYMLMYLLADTSEIHAMQVPLNLKLAYPIRPAKAVAQISPSNVRTHLYETAMLYLLQDDSMPVELVSSGGSVLDLCWYSESKGCQLPHLPQE